MISYSENDKCNFLHILKVLNAKSVKIYTNKELSEFLGVSNKTLIEFRKGNILRFDLLIQYAALLGDEVLFTLKSEL